MFRAMTGLLLFPLCLGAEVIQPVPGDWTTVAERTGYQATASHAETVAYLDRLAQASPYIESTNFGYSAEGRELPLVIVSRERLFSAGAALASGKPIVLIQSCIHSGEVDGKTASLMILRDIAQGRRTDLLDAGVILFAPIYNADGHERISPVNRANQNGPEGGMGFRTTTQGLDLNRDHIKLDSVEAQALIALVARWRPHIHIDNHVTNGSEHHWVLTWSRAEAPQLAPSLDLWLDTHMPAVTHAVENAGFPTGPYVSLIDGSDPTMGFDSRVSGPRYSTGYFCLRNRISILVEMYAYADFKTRVLANRRFLEELLLEVGHSGESLIEATNKAEQTTIELGGADAPPSKAALRWKTSGEADTVAFPVCRWSASPSVVTGRPTATYTCGEDDPIIDVPWYHRPETELVVDRPRGYLVLPGWPQINARISAHGLSAHRLISSTEIAVDTLRVSQPEFADRPYQGRIQAGNFNVDRSSEVRRIPAGALWIPADQANFEIAIQMFEPEAPDSLLRWGLLHSVFERKEYIGVNKLGRLATDMLDAPDIAASWDSALQDSDFADNPTARYLWWYTKTPYWDETVGLMPIFRVMTTPDLKTEEWVLPSPGVGTP